MGSVFALYTRKVARVPPPAQDAATSYRVTVTRANGALTPAWLAEVEGVPESAARGETPEDAIRRSIAAARTGSAEGTADAGEPEGGSRHSGRLLVRMPASLHDELARAAAREGVSLNQLITGILAGAVEWPVSGEALPSGVLHTRSAGQRPPRGLGRIALAVNLGAVVIAAVAAIILIVIAWQHGW